VSKDEQKKRFLKRMEEPEKRWKFSVGDIKERDRWDDYMNAYQSAIRHTSAPWAPWVVVPADHKWFARLVVVAAITDALESLHLEFPTLDKSELRELAVARVTLEAE
jgi:polyphosphate kinase 2 (PPK2 family)